MAPSAAISLTPVLLFVSFAAGGVSAATFTVTNRCNFTVWPAATLAEYMLGLDGHPDYYVISLLQGFNVPMEFKCSTGEAIRCMESSCPDAIHLPGDDKFFTCDYNSDYQVVFCP